jgi:hypothetical protein
MFLALTFLKHFFTKASLRFGNQQTVNDFFNTKLDLVEETIISTSISPKAYFKATPAPGF